MPTKKEAQQKADKEFDSVLDDLGWEFRFMKVLDSVLLKREDISIKKGKSYTEKKKYSGWIDKEFEAYVFPFTVTIKDKSASGKYLIPKDYQSIEMIDSFGDNVIRTLVDFWMVDGKLVDEKDYRRRYPVDEAIIEASGIVKSFDMSKGEKITLNRLVKRFRPTEEYFVNNLGEGWWSKETITVGHDVFDGAELGTYYVDIKDGSHGYAVYMGEHKGKYPLNIKKGAYHTGTGDYWIGKVPPRYMFPDFLGSSYEPARKALARVVWKYKYGLPEEQYDQEYKDQFLSKKVKYKKSKDFDLDGEWITIIDGIEYDIFRDETSGIYSSPVWYGGKRTEKALNRSFDINKILGYTKKEATQKLLELIWQNMTSVDEQ